MTSFFELIGVVGPIAGPAIIVGIAWRERTDTKELVRLVEFERDYYRELAKVRAELQRTARKERR